MIQTLLIMAIVGLAMAHLYTTMMSQEPFFDFDSRKGKNPVGPATGEDPQDLTLLARPKPFNPLDNVPVMSPPDSRRKVATPYRDLGPDGITDLESDDDPRDLPWIASWSAADTFCRQGHNCAVKYIKEGRDGTNIITTSKSCEAGMPHTRAGDRIIVPDSIPEPFRAEIIAHELIHIYQRREPAPWADFYRRNWSFTLQKTPPPSIPPSIREARRGNPDTFEIPWSCWLGRYWPVPVYTNPQTPDLRDAVTVWWDEREKKVLTEPPANWTAFFGRPSQNEHPHEMSAVMIVAADTSSEAGRRLMNWWRTGGATMIAKRKSQS